MPHSTPSFPSAMQALLAHLGIDARREPEHEVYTLNYPAEEAVLYCLSGEEGWFDVLAEGAVLRNMQSAQTLSNVLSLNRPPVVMQFDADSGSLIVWGRIALDGLTARHSADLVQQALERVLALRACLRNGDRAPATASKAAGALLRGLQFSTGRS